MADRSVTWPASLAALAEKALKVAEIKDRPWYEEDDLGRTGFAFERQFIAAATPKKVRALCELAEAVREVIHEVDHGVCYPDLLQALAAVEALEKEEA